MEQKDYRLAAIMHTDIAGFSEMMETNESGTLDTLRIHNKLIGDSVAAHGGRVIKSVGDIFLSEFPNTVDAVKSAVQIQNDIAAHNASEPVMPIYLRVGIHLGDIYFFEDDALGEGVSIASRLQALAQPGRICVSQDVLNLVAKKLDLTTRSLGQSKLKGISREIETHEIAVNPGAEKPGTTAPGFGPPVPPAPSSAPGAPGSPGATAGAKSGSGLTGALRENLRSPEYADFNELKAIVLAEIKRAGRRLSVDDVRGRLPSRSPDVDEALERLAQKGFLTRGPSRSMGEDIRSTVERRVSDTIERATAKARAKEDWDRDWSNRGRSGRQSEDDEARIQARWDRALEDAPAPTDGYDSLVEDYKDHVAAAAEREKAGFRGHLISYIAVNAGLVFLWSMVMFGGFPWFLIVALGWGIGLASHYSGAKQKIRESKDLDGFPSLNREQLRIYRKLAKARSNWTGHLVSNAATAIFLAALNLIVSPMFFWAAFPIGFMAIGLFSHLPAFKSKERRLLQRLRDAGASIAHLFRGKRAAAEPPPKVATGGPNTASYEAEQVRLRIESKLAALPDNAPVGDDFMPVLQNYVDQIKTLDQKNRELDQIMHGIPVAELQRDLQTLQKQRSETENAKVIAEYDESIRQIEKQQTSFGELQSEREILRLRLASGLSQLKQMEIDLARMASISSGDEVASIEMLRNKSDELSQYLDDLREGYKELE